MTTYTNLLGLALPITGQLSGTWGDTVNDYITQYIDAAVAGAVTVNADTTLTKATGSALGSTSSQYAIIIASGHSVNITVTAPAASKVYLILNKSGSYTVKIRGAGPTTGVTIAANKAALVAWDGSDFALVASTDVTALIGTLAATSGGTGQSSYAVGDLLYASTTTALSKLADVATGNALISGGVGVAPAYGKIGLTTHVSGTLPVGNGGTGLTTYVVGDIVYASAAGTLASLADVATGNALISGGVGVAPSYGKIGLTTHVSGTLGVANGGTGAASLTSNNVILGNGTSAVQFVAPGTNGNVLVSNGTTWQSQASTAFLSGQTDSVSPFETSFGYQAGNVNTGTENVFVGFQAGVLNTTGTKNTVVGAFAYAGATTGTRNAAFGSGAMSALTSGEDNVAVGDNTMLLMTTGYSNTGIGSGTLSSATGNNSTAVGYYALNKVTSALSNTAVGSSAGTRVTTGAGNVLLGSTAGSFINTGGGNIVIGDQAASTGVNNLTSGASNTLIGTNVVPSSATVSFELTIGSGLTGKGTQTAFIGGTNGAYNAKNVTTWETTSDERIKCNIVDSPTGLAEVKQLRVRNFNYRQVEDMPKTPDGKPVIDNLNPERLITGFIAQELQAVMPECVNTTASGLLSVSSDAVIYALVKAVQELAAEVETLKARV